MIVTQTAKLPTYYLPTKYLFIFVIEKRENPKVTMKTYHPDSQIDALSTSLFY
jgi:hypothetical protein